MWTDNSCHLTASTELCDGSFIGAPKLATRLDEPEPLMTPSETYIFFFRKKFVVIVLDHVAQGNKYSKPYTALHRKFSFSYFKIIN